MRTSSPPPRPVLGILGGMGPVASAEFVRTLYARAAFRTEQSAPACILLSEPWIPDRTRALADGRGDQVLQALAGGLERLEAAGASRTVALCVSAHHWVPRLPPARRRALISLVDVALGAMAAAPGRALVLCSTGTRRARILESHPHWPAVAERAVFPRAEDQARVHRWIFALKARRRPRAVPRGIAGLMARYGADRWVAACTELHIAARALRGGEGPASRVLDPLQTIADEFDRFMKPAPPAVEPGGGFPASRGRAT